MSYSVKKGQIILAVFLLIYPVRTSGTDKFYLGNGNNNRIFRFEMDNDLVWKKDSGFTNGWSIQYHTPCATHWENMAVPELIKWVGRHVPTLDGQDALVRLSHGLGQNMVTPGDLKADAPEQGDLPYAGSLTCSMSWQNFNRTRASTFQLSAGILGEEAMAGQLQTFFHEKLNLASSPNGWDTQRKTEPILNAGYQYAFNLASAGCYNNDWAGQVFAAPGVSLGNLFTAAELTLVLRAGWNMREGFNTWSAPPGRGFFQAQDLPKPAFTSPHSIELILGGRATALAYSVIYDGSLITGDDRDVARRYWLVSYGIGICYHYYNYFCVRATLEKSTDLLDSDALPAPGTRGGDKTDSQVSFGSLMIDFYF